MSLAPRLRCVNVPSTKQPFRIGLVSPILRKAVSRATFSCGAAVLIIVDQRASTGKSKVPSANVASSKKAFMISSLSGSKSSFISRSRSAATPFSYFSPIKRRNTSVNIISRFSKNEPEFFACLSISLHLKSMFSRFSTSSFVFLAIILFYYRLTIYYIHIKNLILKV